jgi:hypothetical protein
LKPAPCAFPPPLPCRPDCRGWVVRGPVLHPCVICDEWTSGDVLAHMDVCPPCRDLAVHRGAFEPVHRLFEGLHLVRSADGWRAEVIVRDHTVVTTAVYEERADAAEAGHGWLRKLRGELKAAG